MYVCIDKDQKIIYQNVHSANLLLLELWDLYSSFWLNFLYCTYIFILKITKMNFKVHVSGWTQDL